MELCRRLSWSVGILGLNSRNSFGPDFTPSKEEETHCSRLAKHKVIVLEQPYEKNWGKRWWRRVNVSLDELVGLMGIETNTPMQLSNLLPP